MFCLKVKIFFIIYLFFMLYGTILSEILQNSPPENSGDRGDHALRFRLPFTELEIASQQSVIVLKESRNHAIFILHGIELYHLLISPNNTKLSMIGKLMARENQLQHSIHADVIAWRSTVIFVVAREKYLEVYQIAQTAITEQKMSNETQEFLPIQEITMEGYFKELRLFTLESERIVLMVIANVIQHHGSLKTYEWVDTYFNILEIMTLPPIQSLNVVNSHTNYIIIGMLNEDQTMMTLRIFEMEISTIQMKSIQTLVVATGITHSWTFQENNYMALCPTYSIRSKCIFYKMIDNRFRLIQNNIKSEGIINNIIAGEHFIVSEQEKEVVVYSDINFNCFAGFNTNLTNATSIMILPQNGNTQFILFNYIQPKSALLRIVQIEYDVVSMPRSMDFEEVDSIKKPHWYVFEDVLMKLRSILLKRKAIMEYFREASNILSPKVMKFKTKNPVRIHAGNIELVQIIEKTLRSPTEMLQEIANISHDHRMLLQSKGSGHLYEYNGGLKMIAEECYVQNLIYNRSVVDGFSITTKVHSIPMLTVEQFLITERLETLELLTEQIPDNSGIYRTRERIGSTYRTRKLVVNRINGIVWKEFYDSLFLRNRNSQITGQMIFQKPVRVGDLNTKKLNHIETRNIFNLNKPQTVRSNIKISRFFASSMQLDEMNGLNITKDIARRGVNNFIRSPVDIYEVSVIGDLLLSEDDDFVKRHVLETSSVDLQQTYTGQVVLNGSLTIKDLFIEDPDSTMLIIDGHQFSEKIIQTDYMRKNQSQIFSYPVTFANAKITAPKLETIFLNEHPYSEHLLTTGNNVENAKLLLILMSASIPENIHLDKEFPSKLRQLKTDIVRRNENALITGIKYFSQSLTIESLNVTMLNQKLVNDFVRKSEKIVHFLDRKIFSQIVVRSEFLVEDELTVDAMNNVSLNIERHYDSVKLTEKLNASNVIFGNINGMSFDKIFPSVEVSKNGNLILHKDLYVEGSVHFAGDLKADRVNGINLNDYLASLVRLDENTVISGKKTFANSLQITNDLRTSTINRINIDEMLSNIFVKSQPQIITGSYTFDSLLLTDAIVPIINDMNTNLFIDQRSSNVTINSDVIVQKVKVLGNILGQFKNNIIDLTALTQMTTRNVTKTSWREIIVLGNAKWNENEETDILEHFNAHAVRRFGQQVITGNVKLKKPVIKSMTTTSQDIFDGLNIEFIASDCLFKNHSKLQIITVAKTFDAHLKLAQVEANGLVGAKFVNRIDVAKLNSTIYRRNDLRDLFSPLRFHIPLKVDILSVNGTLNGITENQIYHNFDQPLPSLQIDQLFVEDVLLVKNVNHISLDELMRNRIPKTSENVVNVSGFLTFQNLSVDNKTILKSINEIEIDEIVLKRSQELQTISAPKIIKGNLTLNGPVQIDSINNKNIRDKYQETIFLNANYVFDELSIDSAVFRGGLLIASMQSENENFSKSITELKNIEQQLTFLVNHLNENNYRFLYFDYDDSPAVEWSSINDTTSGWEELIFNLNSKILCNQQLVKLSINYNQIHLNRAISNTITVAANGLQVVANNYCNKFYSFANSEIAIRTATNLFKIFQLKNHIRTVDLLIVDTDTFILLHTIDLITHRNDVRILKVNPMSSDIVDWQTLSQDIGDATKIYKFANYTTIVSSAIVENQPVLTIYAYSCILKRFVRQQVFSGDFNIIEMIRIDQNKYHLYLSCNGCQYIVIYQFDARVSNMFLPNSYLTFQIIEEKMKIAALNAFIVNGGEEDDVYLFAIPKQQSHDFYHIYRYSATHGYVHFTIGDLPADTQLIIPLLGASRINRIDGMPILLLCNSDGKCSLLKAYFQF